MENTIKKIKELTAKVENSGNINDAEELMAEVYLLMLKIDPKFIPKTAYIHYLAKERQYFDDEFETVMETNQTEDCVKYYKGLPADDKEKFKDTILENIKRARLYTVQMEQKYSQRYQMHTKSSLSMKKLKRYQMIKEDMYVTVRVLGNIKN